MNGNRPSPAPRLKILLLCVLPRTTAATIRDHVDAFPRHSRHRVQVVQNLTALYGTFGGRLSTLPNSLDLGLYDVVVIHYSNYLPSDVHFEPSMRERLRKFAGLKVLFLQDEYRQIDVISDAIRDLGIGVLFTCVPEREIEKVYPAGKFPGLVKVNNLTGYVPPGLPKRKVKPLAERPLDVGYRTRQTPFWLGELGAEKWQIAPKFLEATAGEGLRCDISYREEDRLYGKHWIRFLGSSRSVLGTESGASVFDFTGELQLATEQYLASHPGATFEDVQQRFLKEHEGRIRLNQISPRCFEAAALRTAMVLYEGEYSGVLEPGRHYVPLRKDFSNIDEVVRTLRDTAGLQELVDRTYREIALNEKYSYRSFIEMFDAVIDREFHAREIPASNGDRLASMFRTHVVAAESIRSVVRVRMFPILLKLRFGFELWKFRILHTLLGLAYKFYIRILPAKIRDRLRPAVRRILFRDSV